MTEGRFSHLRYQFEFPSTEPPGWAPMVERWYQLDAFAFGLPQAYVSFADDLQEKPDVIVLASPEGSNRTDFDFAQAWLKNGVGSPSKFVHTLPNSRSAALLQVMEWSGPLLCVQNDPATLVSGFEEAMLLAKSGQKVWLMSVTRSTAQLYETHLFCFGATGDFRWQENPNEVNSTTETLTTDAQLLETLSAFKAGVLLNSGRYEIFPNSL